jgi:ribonuclease HI
MRREREAEESRRKAEAAIKAAAIWQAAQPAPADHPYLIRKHIKAHGWRVRLRRLDYLYRVIGRKDLVRAETI